MLKSRSEIAAIVDRYVEELRRQGIDVQSVYLYGSYLRGTPREFSDIDLVVVSPSFEVKEPWERPKIIGKARHQTFQATGESVEALAKTPQEVAAAHPTSFLADVLKDAEIVYEAAPAESR